MEDQMSYITRRTDAPDRSAPEIGPGDYVKIGSTWEKVATNDVHGQDIHSTPEWRKGNWRVTTENGSTRSGWGINNYAKAEDMEER
jgi:hypothetical protein